MITVRRLAVMVILLALTIAVVGCGAPPAPVTTILACDASLSGMVTYNGSTYTSSFEVDEVSLGYSVLIIPIPPELGGGTITTRSHSRILLSFVLPAALNGAEIQSAQLQLHPSSITGTPFTNCGAAQIVHASFASTAAAANLYSGCALGGATEAFSSATALNWALVDVTAAVRNDVDNSGACSQFRLQHATELMSGSTSHYSRWVCGTASTTNYARLVITYIPATEEAS